MKPKTLIIILCIILTITIGGIGYITFVGTSSNDIEGLDKQQMRQICELSTLETTYHDTARYESEDTWFIFFKQKQKLWIEYNGTITIGTEMAKLNMQVKGNKVTITVPHSKITAKSIDKDSMKYISDYSGIFTDSVSFEQQQKALKRAQKKMEEVANTNQMLFVQADARTEELLKNYVKNIGTLLNKKYKTDVQFTD